MTEIELMSKQNLEGLAEIINMNARTIACQCECMGMTAENFLNASFSTSPTFKKEHFIKAMQKYGILDEKGRYIL